MTAMRQFTARCKARQQAIQLTDKVWAYRQDPRDYSAAGQSLGFRPVPSVQGSPCKRHATPNYDAQSPVGLSKEESLLTADRLQYDVALDIRPEDALKIVIATGQTIWEISRGDSQIKPLFFTGGCYATPQEPPTILATNWLE